MKLSVRERILILNFLPKETNFLTLKIVRQLENDLSFSETEIKELKMIADEKQLNWSLEAEQKAGEKEIKIGEKATDIIIDCLKKMDKENKLTKDHITIYEKFIKE